MRGRCAATGGGGSGRASGRCGGGPRSGGRSTPSGEDPLKDSRQTYLANAHAFQRALDDFTDDCTKRGASKCPLGGDPSAARKEIRQLFDLLDGREIETAAGVLDQTTFVDALTNAMYTTELWPDLRRAPTALGNGNGAPLVRLAGGGGGAGAPGSAVPGAVAPGAVVPGSGAGISQRGGEDNPPSPPSPAATPATATPRRTWRRPGPSSPRRPRSSARSWPASC